MDCNTEKSINNDDFSDNLAEALFNGIVYSRLLLDRLNHPHDAQDSSQSPEGPNLLGLQLVY